MNGIVSAYFVTIYMYCDLRVY